MFSTSQLALQVVKAYQRKGNLYLNRDLTPRQQNISYLVRSEFKQRKQSGENDIVLKYENGIPKIIAKQTKNV